MDDILINHTLELFEKKEFKKKFIKKVNENVDIPILNENTEKKIYDHIYKVIIKTVQELR